MAKYELTLAIEPYTWAQYFKGRKPKRYTISAESITTPMWTVSNGKEVHRSVLENFIQEVLTGENNIIKLRISGEDLNVYLDDELIASATKLNKKFQRVSEEVSKWKKYRLRPANYRQQTYYKTLYDFVLYPDTLNDEFTNTTLHFGPGPNGDIKSYDREELRNKMAELDEIVRDIK